MGASVSTAVTNVNTTLKNEMNVGCNTLASGECTIKNVNIRTNCGVRIVNDCDVDSSCQLDNTITTLAEFARENQSVAEQGFGLDIDTEIGDYEIEIESILNEHCDTEAHSKNTIEGVTIDATGVNCNASNSVIDLQNKSNVQARCAMSIVNEVLLSMDDKDFSETTGRNVLGLLGINSTSDFVSCILCLSIILSMMLIVAYGYMQVRSGGKGQGMGMSYY